MTFKLTSRGIALVVWDVFATYIAFIAATYLTRLEAEMFANTNFLFMYGIIAVITVAAMICLRLYNDLWEYASIDELLKILLGTLVGVVIGSFILFLGGWRMPLRICATGWVILLLLTGGIRFAFRLIYRGKRTSERRPAKGNRPRTLIVGAGETGSLTIKRMVAGDYAMQGLPVLAVDDDPKKIGMHINGVRVRGNIEQIPEYIKECDIEQIVIAIPSAEPEELKRIYDVCVKTDCKLLTLPNVKDMRVEELGSVQLREVKLEDLLHRPEVKLNTRMVSGFLSGKTVLVTGGGGSIGSELCRQICAVAPKRLVIFDIYENGAYDLQQELRSLYDDVEICVEIGSVRDEERLERLFSEFKPQIVFHAAAHKHVPLMEDCPREAVLNNVFGTLNCALKADAHGAERFVFISTDKAVNPTSVMGATKRMGEMVIQYLSHTSKTVFAAVRFGNVLGSSGSVVPLFKQQIAAGGPITVTHPDITRYFMTIPEAARLVVQAGGLAKGGEIFILDMGEPVRIADLAKSLIRLAGLKEGQDIKIEYIGLRPGEKLYEELLMDNEQTIDTTIKGIMVSTAEAVSHEEVDAKLAALRACTSLDDEAIKACLQEQVPTFHPMTEEA